MTLIPKRLIIIFVLIIAGIVLGRLAVRGFMNLLLGGTLFGGNHIVMKEKKIDESQRKVE